jgi:hypothetical protein
MYSNGVFVHNDEALIGQTYSVIVAISDTADVGCHNSLPGHDHVACVEFVTCGPVDICPKVKGPVVTVVFDYPITSR